MEHLVKDTMRDILVSGMSERQETSPTFVDAEEFEKYKCSICLQILCNPSDIGCDSGHIYCYQCILSLLYQNHGVSESVCPQCRGFIKRPVRKLPFIERLIKGLKVECFNHEINAETLQFVLSEQQRENSHHQQHRSCITIPDDEETVVSQVHACIASVPPLEPSQHDRDTHPCPHAAAESKEQSPHSSRDPRPPSRSASSSHRSERRSHSSSRSRSRSRSRTRLTQVQSIADEHKQSQSQSQSQDHNHNHHHHHRRHSQHDQETQMMMESETSGDASNAMMTLMHSADDAVDDEGVDIDCSAYVCDWIGAYGDLHEHMLRCPYQVVTCDYCKKTSLRKHLVEHETICPNFPVICEQCNESVARNALQWHLAFTCPKQWIECGCGEQLLREQQPLHKERDCPEALVQCEYFMYGCKQMVKRRSFESHNKRQMAHHLALVTKQCSGLTNQVVHLMARIENIEQRLLSDQNNQR